MNMEKEWRYNSLWIVLTIVAVLVWVQLFRIQLDPSHAKSMLDQAVSLSGVYRTVSPPRGLIYDRWGNVLAGNSTVYTVAVDLNKKENSHSISLALNVVLGLDYSEVYEAIEYPPEGVVYVVLDDFVSPEKVEQLKKYAEEMETTSLGNQSEGLPSLSGLDFQPHLQRSYPEKELGSNILGFVSREGFGYFGIEEKFNDLLAGTPQRVWFPYNPTLVGELVDTPESTSIILTIDREIQTAMEEIVDNAVETNGAESGTIVVMDPKTGEIYAMATTPRMNINKYWQYGDVFTGSTPFNRGISQAYEPGSVYKVLTMATALDSGAVTTDTIFLDTGVFEIGGIYIYNWNQGSWGPQTMQGCMQHSLNVCLAWIASEVGAKDFYTYMNAFGIGHLSNIDLAGETQGRLKSPGDEDWFDADLGTNAFGQGVSATPLQMATAISAIANNGKVPVPRIVRSIIRDGHQIDTEPRISSIPISSQTAYTLTEMLASSLEKEASTALIDGYRVAGKTGTAEIPTPYGYTSNVTNVSFVGWGPVDDVEFLAYIWLEKPTSSIWGSEVAAPIFKQVAEKLVVLLDIPPDETRNQLYGQ